MTRSIKIVEQQLLLLQVIAVPDEASRHNAPSNSLAIYEEVNSVSKPEGVKVS